MKSRSWVLFAPCLAALVLTARPASSAGPQVSPAQALFVDAVTLMEKNQFDAACPKLEQSFALERVPGTLFALGDCEEQRGRVATALRWYDEYLATYETLPVAKKQDHAERAKQARAQREALRPAIPQLTLVLLPGTPASIAVTLDGRQLATSSLGVPIDLDPGEHQIVTQLPGGPSKTTSVKLGKGQRERWPLVFEPAPVQRPDPIDGNNQRVSGNSSNEPASTTGGQRMGGFVAGGVGVAGVLVGAIAGGMAISAKNAMEQDCAATAGNVMTCQTQAGVDAGNRATTLGNVSTAGLVIGAAGLAVGAVLVVLDGRKTKPSGEAPGPTVTARVGGGASGVGVSLHGVW
ncbi:tetratricopeptide repeat protein [Polyangium sorediatum]|uniref:Tetratricopeptide repeat protein n=1 Tax=Polyangium sorediatum TaxID=889274 RepID=A0ABT6NXX0_9BACT|nr:tetratricopeptide repeat protein [Polyangium sorediatum]MDI1433195.1 tetratricopeptide repeat protein [Polyangium sorediatum]